jgi:hypothetical protein
VPHTQQSGFRQAQNRFSAGFLGQVVTLQATVSLIAGMSRIIVICCCPLNA